MTDRPKSKLRVKTLFVSDIHLGMADSKAVQAAHMLRHCKCEKLVLNGDIIDVWALKTSGRWTHEHTHFVRTVLKKIEKEGLGGGLSAREPRRRAGQVPAVSFARLVDC
jgi:hypothetical protein